MKLDFLLEIGCEELPATFLHPMVLKLEKGITDLLSNSSIALECSTHYYTPRRLIIHLKGVQEKQAARQETVTGPPYKIAFDDEGKPSQATKGFASKNNIDVSGLSKISTDKGFYIGFKRHIAGNTSKSILLKELNGIIHRLELPKGMRWEPTRLQFVRPIRWILCLLGDEVLPLRIAGIEASNYTFGHRILSKNNQTRVDSFSEYERWLKSNSVEIDPEIRKQKIQDQLITKAKFLDGYLIEDSKLLETVMNLMENPTVIAGRFDKAFLNLPSEILITVMREHQKYFSVKDKDSELLPNFLAVVDSQPQYCKQIGIGHERVLKARLSDAMFFWKFDLQITLNNRIGMLKNILFQEKLGTLFDKTQRIKRLSKFLAAQFDYSSAPKILDKAAEVCKTDLTTEMVKEFSGLQGIIGGLYAKEQGEDSLVFNAVSDHYLPTFFGDKVPRDLTGSILSIADKIDNITTAFAVDLIPTGSSDPLALRRQTLGIIQILIENNLDCSFRELLHESFLAIGSRPQTSFEPLNTKFSDFLRERLKFVFRNEGFNHDEVNSVLGVFIDNPVECRRRLLALKNFRGSNDLLSVASSFKRIKNILSKSNKEDLSKLKVKPELFILDEERNLHSEILKNNNDFLRALGTLKHEQGLQLLASLRPVIDSFFDKVLVMDKDRLVKENRLALLFLLLKTFLSFADISELVINQ